MDRRQVLKAAIGSAIAGAAGIESAQAAPKNPEKIDFDEDVAKLENEAKELLAAIAAYREMKRSPATLDRLGNELSIDTSIVARAEAIGKLVSRLKQKN